MRFVNDIAQEHNLPAMFPVHPHTCRVLNGYGDPREAFDRVVMVPPLAYPAFMRLLAECALVVTDSGGVQEETCSLGIPTLTVRNTTERPETVLARNNIVVSPNLLDTDLSRTIVRRLLTGPWGRDAQDFSLGKGGAGRNIVCILRARFGG
jgi:UDP-N-acetylglucosamine 2-epimerase (non-hydrolysing)